MMSRTTAPVTAPVADQVTGSIEPDFTTDCVVIGSGPAGGSLAAFLAYNGVKGILLSRESSTADTPRAHLTNSATMECLRDIGLEDQCRKLSWGKTGDTRFSYSMAGEEYARAYSFGNGPLNEGRWRHVTPCDPIDLPQNKLEPQFINYAATHGFLCRFNTEFVSFTENENGTVDVTVKDIVFQRIYKIRCKFLFGADGARSSIVRQLDLPLTKDQGGGLAWSILIKADLSHLMDGRQGSLHWIYQHDVDHPEWAWIGFPRMVNEWDEWLVIFLPVPGYKLVTPPTTDEWLKRINQFIGDDSVKPEILDIAKWQINEIYANQYSKGRIFGLGDAVHRHPPANGLGSNTCVQDAFNLAWKISYVLKGIAGIELLDSYNAERQPVGKAIVERANDGVRTHLKIWQAVGILGGTVEDRLAQFAELSEDSDKGRERRIAFQKAIEGTENEYQGLGIEMNQRYVSKGVYQADQGEAPKITVNPILQHVPTTYPGARVPHAWLNTTIPSKAVSTIDLTGHGRFTLLTGVGSESWKKAAAVAAEKLGIPIKAISIGPRQEYTDPYFQWARLREVDDYGCVLVRPDRFVAWRSKGRPDNCEGLLFQVLQSILSIS